METLFLQATRAKFRFPSTRGELSVEMLWDVPLRSKDDLNLDRIARGINRELEQATEESFVDEATTNPATKLLTAKLGIVKQIIAIKLEEEETAKVRAENKQEREKLLKILAEKQDGELSELSVKELKKRIEALK